MNIEAGDLVQDKKAMNPLARVVRIVKIREPNSNPKDPDSVILAADLMVQEDDGKEHTIKVDSIDGLGAIVVFNSPRCLLKDLVLVAKHPNNEEGRKPKYFSTEDIVEHNDFLNEAEDPVINDPVEDHFDYPPEDFLDGL